MLSSLSRIRKALAAGVGTGTAVYASVAALSTVAWWVPITVAAVAAVAVGGVTYLIPNALPAPTAP